MSHVYALVPARGGSERLPRKNMCTINGRTLVQCAIDSVWGMDCHVVVSTDDDEIARHSEHEATIHRRPAHLAGPRSQIEEAMHHWLIRQKPVLRDDDVLLLLQPTSPFRKPGTVARCVELVRSGYDSALTVCLDHRNTGRLRSHADGTLRTIWNRPLSFRPRSQDDRTLAVENGCVYACSVKHFRRSKLRHGGTEAIVPIDWLEALEIDDALDLAAARALAPVAFGGREAA